MSWIEKGWAEKHRQEASEADYDRDVQKKKWGRRKGEKNQTISLKAKGTEKGNDQKGIYLSFSSKLGLTLY